MIKTYTIGEFQIPVGKAWSHPINGNQYPSNWIDLASDADLTSHGITKTTTPNPTPDYSKIRSDLRDRVTDYRDRVWSLATVLVNGASFDCDRVSVDSAVGRLALGDLAPWPQDWRDSNNIIRQLSKNDFTTMCLMMAGTKEAIFHRSWELKDIALSDTDPNRIPDAQLLTINVQTLWDTWVSPV